MILGGKWRPECTKIAHRSELRSEDHYCLFSSQKKSRFASDFLRRGNRASWGLKKSRDIWGSGKNRRRSRRESRDFCALRWRLTGAESQTAITQFPESQAWNRQSSRNEKHAHIQLRAFLNSSEPCFDWHWEIMKRDPSPISLLHALLLTGPAAIVFILRSTCRDTIANWPLPPPTPARETPSWDFA